MATRRTLARAALGASKKYAPRAPLLCKSPIVATVSRAAPPLHRSQLRSYSVPKQEQPPAETKIYSFDEVLFSPSSLFFSTRSPADHPPSPQIKNLALHPTPSRILIDTREPCELRETGTIPSAINIPIKSQPDALFLSADEFEDKFGFPIPAQDAELVFFCKAGVRSRTAAVFAREAGWENVAEYPGSWMDWEKQGGERKSVH